MEHRCRYSYIDGASMQLKNSDNYVLERIAHNDGPPRAASARNSPPANTTTPRNNTAAITSRDGDDNARTQPAT
jgi:hypothetical protein